MSLVPYALRPRSVLRRQVIKRGVVGRNPYLRPLAMLLIGQGDYLRVKALRQGLGMGNPFWRAVGIALLLREANRRVFAKPTERLAVERIRAGGQVRVTVMEPTLSRRGRKRALARLEADALASVAAAKRSS